MVKHYDKSEMIEIVFIEYDIVKDGKKLDYYHHRLICPECKEHKQTPCGDCDCKNLYTINNVEGQCCCYSEIHK